MRPSDKKVELAHVGAESELDRQVLEMIQGTHDQMGVNRPITDRGAG